MKLNIADPISGGQKTFEFEDERRLLVFMDKRISQEVEMDSCGEEWAGYVVKITGGHDKQGFPMYQGVLMPSRVQLLLNARSYCLTRGRNGERQRKSVRGCIVDHDISIINVVIVKRGANPIPGLTDKRVDARLGPKRASKIRKMFDLDKQDDVRQYVVRRSVQKEGKKAYTKAPKIQRLITPIRLHRKRTEINLKKASREKTAKQRSAYVELLSARRKAAHDKKRAGVEAAAAAAAAKAAPAAGKAGKVAGKAGKSAPAAAAPAAGKAGKVAGKAGKAAPAAAAPAPAKPAAAAPPAASAAKGGKGGKAGRRP